MSSDSPQQIPEVTVSFDSFESGALLPETTMAFDTGSSNGAPYLPDPTQYPAVVSYARREEVGRGGMAKIFSADDPLLARFVATASEDHSVKIWDLRTEKMLQKIALLSMYPLDCIGILTKKASLSKTQTRLLSSIYSGWTAAIKLRGAASLCLGHFVDAFEKTHFDQHPIKQRKCRFR